MALQIGQTISLKIEDIAFGGEGVGRHEDFVVFVPFVLEGETAEVEITEVKKNFARAKLLRIGNPSSDRVEAPCVYFGKCGGCQYQHAAYAAQLRIKQKQIADLFERVGKIPGAVVAPVIPCPSPYGYRNRIMVRSQWNKPEQKLNIGFVRCDGGLVEDIEKCIISEPAINEQLAQVRAHPPPKGGIKVVLRVQPEGWELPPDSFFQNNFFLLPELVNTVRGFLRAGGAKHLADLYCGVGFFGIELAGSVERFTGVEYDRRAVQAAGKNAAARNIKNGRFIPARVEEVLADLLNPDAARETTVLIDPPRKGCGPDILKLLRSIRPRQIIYVSCHPATMARDLNILRSEGVFELQHVQPLDMFPQTQHVECVADLRSCDPDQPQNAA
ncbi:MAG TPA: class I SAM-dependent RNA methyltransferase [Verrucomicrobiae bacterium]|jgi:tRNA/tmRNA/rRNA uracil-C5-methylase (TrmA/RlmC/RlmD family)|nr:class I SAM-dependent RNA methyltransferase [Verrucomicrobiae bacterium]